MGDLKDPRWIHLKGWLFLLILVSSSVLLVAEYFNLKIVFLLGLVIWSSARFYYYMFYVIEKYVDGRFRFSGVGSFLSYVFSKRRSEV